MLSIQELDEALKPVVVPGLRIRLPLVRSGKEDHQAVGYLSDGTLIVVNHGAAKIGSTALVVITSTLQTGNGTMVFAELHSPDGDAKWPVGGAIRHRSARIDKSPRCWRR